MAEFISVAELRDPDSLSSEEFAEIGLQWEFPLPAHINRDADRLEVNVSRLKRLHKVGAFSGSIVTEYYGDTSETTGVAGINADGSAVAGIVKTNLVESARSRLIEDGLFSSLERLRYGKPIIQHEVNRSEAVQQVIDLKQKGHTDLDAWAQVLDGALRCSLLMAGKANLIDRDSNLWRKTTDYAATLMTLGTVVAFPALEVLPPIFLEFYVSARVFGISVDMLANKVSHGDLMLDQRRWSFFDLSQPDRYLAFGAINRLSGLIRSRQ